MARVGILWDRVFLSHDTGPGHPETAERLLAIKEALDAFDGTSELVNVAAREATDDELLQVHSESHLARLADSERRDMTFFDADTPASRDSHRVARLAAGGCIELTARVLARELDCGCAFPRPPGHHAERDVAMGFCLLNNVAVAAAWAIRSGGADRVAVVDFDVHHGNGTQHIFYERRDVLYVSSHRYPFYPGTGAAGEIGDGEGMGYTVNVPLPSGCDDDDFLTVYRKIVVPVVEQYAPRLLLVSAGFDIYHSDPLGGMRASAECFGRLATLLRVAAAQRADCRVVFVLEGGYSLEGLRDGTAAILDALSRENTGTSRDQPASSRLESRLIPEIVHIQARRWKL